WNRPYQSLGGETIYRYKLADGLFKFYAAFDATRFELNQTDINLGKIRVDMENRNFYLNTSYDGTFGNAWRISGGFGYGLGHNRIGLADAKVENDENALHAKVKLQKKFSQTFRLNFGGEY